MDRIADTLVLTFSWGMSLRAWDGIGSLSREWAIYERLSRHYDRIVLVTYGTDTHEDRLASELPRHDGARPVEVVWNRDNLDTTSWQSRIPGVVAETLAGTSSVVVKTNQMSGGDVAVAVAEALRAGGVRTGLVARAGYLASLCVGHQMGFESTAAMDAGALEQQLCRAADVVVGSTPKIVQDLAWRYGVSEGNRAVVPNYVIDTEVRTSDDREPGVVLAAGSINAQKGQDVLIRAMALLAGRLTTPLRLEIAGQGPAEDELRALAEELDAPVDFIGPMEHTALLERMSRCSIFVQASSYEGHPKTIIEAMSTGAPVVATDVVGVRDVVEHGVTGIRVGRTPEAFAHVVEGLMLDPDWRDALGSHASDYSRSLFGMATVYPLEVKSHRDAVERAGVGLVASPTGVRWAPTLLQRDAAARVDEWATSLHGFQKRLAPDERVRFLANLEQRVYVMEGEAAVAAEGGLHPKHRYLDFHGWFVDRLESGERVIDLGCGVGALARAMADRAHVTGIDWDADNLAEARERSSSAMEFIKGDITTKRASGSYDTVVLSNVLEHITDRPERLRMWRAWYEPKRFLIRVPAFDREWRVPWKKELGVEWRLDTTHETEYTLAQLEEELVAAGLDMVHSTTRWGEFWVEAVVSGEMIDSTGSTEAA